MKSIGVIRKVDELGRIVLPVEFRRTLNIKNNDSLEIFAQNNSIYITKLNPSCVICGKTTKLTEVGDKYLCRNCLKAIGMLNGEQKTIPFPEEMVDNMWGVLTDAVSASRGIEKAELNRLADELAVMLPEEAVANKLIDGVKYADQMEELFEAEYGIEDVEYITLGEYVTGLKPDVSKVTAPKVAILYAQGQIFDGEGSDDNIYGYTLARQVRELAEDDDIKAVVMRVNSPGGSALASDIVWREVELLKAKKPVIVSMGAYAASGGYYISAPADAIVADKLQKPLNELRFISIEEDK